MKRILTVVSVLGLFALASCTKEQSGGSGTGTKVSSISDIVIPAGFTWENSRDVNFDITVNDAAFPGGTYVIALYDIDPALGGKLLGKGSASVKSHFKTKVYLANTIKEVFVVKTAPDNTTTTQKLSVTATTIAATMSAGASADAGGIKVKGVSDSPNCTTGCTTTVTSSSSITVNSGQTVCITGNNITVSVINYGGVVRVCGTNVTIPSITIDNNGSLVIASTGTVTIGSISLYNANTSFTNYGTTSINGNLAYNATTLNEGTLSMTGDLNIYAGSSFTNNGAVAVGGSFTTSTSNVSTNNGSIIVTGNVNVNSGTTFVNNCSFWGKSSYFNNGTTRNAGLIKVNNDTQVYASSEMGLYNGAMLKTGSIVVSGAIRGNGTKSLVKVSGSSTMYVGSVLNGPFLYCDQNGIENNQSSFTGGAAIGCDLYVAVTNCNSEGNGTAPVTDTDGDGINDTLDEYPTDPAKAFNNYYPSNKETEFATSGFEDQWPNKGDYDLNDVVMAYRYKIVTNATNQVVQLTGNYTLRATGGGQQNGFGVEFPIEAGLVGKVTGGTLETGQAKAVVILFSNMRTEMLNWNTRPAEAVTAPKTYSITMDISSGPSLETFGLGDYNPFTWNGALGRKYEIHLSGKTPTSLADTKLFGTADDNSNAGAAKYYVTKTGLPWGISIPTGTFDYPSEQIEITAAYLKFKQWAESGGKEFADWYGSGSGYRDNTKIYAPK